MPRPSDLYANLGAPGVYQATAWTPAVLPNVFLIPPAEEGEQVYCLFHSGSASPSTYDPFYRDYTFTQRDTATPTVTNIGVLDQALSLLQQQAIAATGIPVYTRRHAWEHGEHAVQPSRSSAYSSDPSPFGTVPACPGAPSVRFVVEHEGEADLQEEQCSLPSRPASRRSSVFGERPSEYEFSEDAHDEEEHGARKAQTMSLRSRAALAFKAFGTTRVKRTESDERDDDEVVHRRASFRLEQGSMRFGNQREPKRRTLSQMFASGSRSSVDVSLTSADAELHPSPAKLSKRKSMTQLFGFTRSATLAKLEVYDTPSSWDAEPGASLASPTPKLSKRKSMSQLLGLTRSALSVPALASAESTHDTGDSSHMTAADAHLVALRALEGPATSKPAPSIKSIDSSLQHRSAASSVTALGQAPDAQPTPTSSPRSDQTSTRRKSFLQGRTLSFLDLHRRLSSHPASSHMEAADASALPAVPRSPPSDATDSSLSNPASTDSEPEVEDTLRVFAPPPATLCFVPNGNGLVDLSSTIELDPRGKDPWFNPSDPGEVEADSDYEPSLQLASRLDSLSFDHLSFDPVLFGNAAQT